MTNTLERTAYFADGPIVLVIGCGDIGMACARALGERSPLVVVDVSQPRLDQAIAALRHDGYSASGYACDIASPGQVRQLGDFLAQGKGVRVLAHVAALGRSAPSWQRVLDVNLAGAHLVAQATGPYMIAGGVGIFISSTGSSMTPTNAAVDELLDDPLRPDFHGLLADAFGREPGFQEAYNISKRGMNRLVQRLAVNWGPRRVRALTVSPGIVDTTMAREGGSEMPVRDAGGQSRMATWAEVAGKTVPLGRQGSILEVSSVVEFMASDAAGFVNGIDIPVDGGSSALRSVRQVAG